MRLVFVVVAAMLLTSCTSVGRKISPEAQGLCLKSVSECRKQDRNFIIKYSISKVGDEYEVIGEATSLAGSTKTFTEIQGSSFVLYLIKDGVIVDEIGIAGGSGPMDRTITFRRKFKGQDFDRSGIGYSMQVRG